jgi:hypothetical protein
LDEIMQRNARIERGEKGGKEEEALAQVRDLAREKREAEEREDAEAAKRAFESASVAQARLEEEIKLRKQASKQDEPERAPQPPPSFERVKKVKNPLVPGLVRKTQPAPAPVVPTKPAGLGLGDYDSDED